MAEKVSNLDYHATSFLSGGNVEYIERLHSQYLTNPQRVDTSWREYFSSLGATSTPPNGGRLPSWARPNWPQVPRTETLSALDGQWSLDVEEVGHRMETVIRARANQGGIGLTDDEVHRQVLDSIRALMVIRAYRIRGHRIAHLDPLGLHHHIYHAELDPANFGFTENDLDRPIFIDYVLGVEMATMRQIVELLKRTYCGTFALQFMHISDPEQSAWLKERIEGYGKEMQFTAQGRRAILNKLIEAEGLEQFFHIKYTGTKRFGIDGGEALIPALEQIIKRGGSLGIKEIVIGMPHRGRLNVLANVMGKPYRAIMHEFHGGSYKPDEIEGSGDVKYHLGASSDRAFDGNEVHLSLTANPSHLEAVNPVVLGKARAKQDHYDDEDRTQVLPVLLHGDAAFAGQGIVAECFGLSGLVGHKTGGTIHFVVNNQIGFTTAPFYSRSSPYPTDIGLMTEAPIFHVNGDDPEAVVHAARVATEFRQKFHKDVIIDMFCYRRFGHNEGDDPMFTQPRMYRSIRKHETTLELYSKKLVTEKLVPLSEIEEKKASFRKRLEEELEAAKNYRPNDVDWLDGRWSHLGTRTGPDDFARGSTGIRPEVIEQIGQALCRVPDGFNLHPTLKRFVENRKKVFASGAGCDWAVAEALAFGSLLLEGYPVRLSGQDSTRGTFSQRHLAFVDQENEEKYYALNNISDNQKHLEVIDSMLSEFAVLGFEYGYSLSEPNALVLWEAQFGDFANGAQIIFDQFIASGERKWHRMSGVTILLPHGFEGQGPEHSSARLERILQLSAEDNWIVANCTTPANYFHILRRQLHRDFRKPLILMTPKSLLRHKMAVSFLADMHGDTSFHRLLWDDAQKGNSDTELVPDEAIRRVVMCSGKVYYDLLAERDKRGIEDIYLLRVEQLYPFPAFSLMSEMERFQQADVVWCQEEPKNQGAWTFIEPNIEWVLNKIEARTRRAKYVGRTASASPATGLLSNHKKEQKRLVDEALGMTNDK